MSSDERFEYEEIDFDTGQPNCVFVQSGALRSVPGECTFTGKAQSTQPPPEATAGEAGAQSTNKTQNVEAQITNSTEIPNSNTETTAGGTDTGPVSTELAPALPPPPAGSGDGETAAVIEGLAPAGDASPDTTPGTEIIGDTTPEPVASDAGELVPLPEDTTTIIEANDMTATSSTP